MRIYFTFLISLICYTAHAQKLSGKILDEKKEPVAGAVVKLDSTGTATNLNGEFTFPNVKPGKHTLKITSLGYAPISRTINFTGADMDLSFNLDVSNSTLNDVVVVGYGSKLKREVTGSIVKVGAKELNDMPVQSFESALQAKVPGLQVTTGSGLAGSAAVIRIRGIASISAGGDPLYVIDGIPITQDYFLNNGNSNGNSGAMNNNPLASINPEDIESIEVLKDAAATAIYGSRGSNGVIIISTKRGKQPGWHVNVSTMFGTSRPTRLPNMLNNTEFLQLYQEAWENDGNTGLAKLPGNIAWEDALNTNTDWVDLTTRVGHKSTQNVGVSYGNKKMNAYLNFGRSNNESYLVGNDYGRNSVRLNMDYKLTSKLTASLSSSVSQGTNNRVNTAWAGGLGAAMSTALPIFPVYNPDGTFFTGGDNPLRAQELKKWQTVENRSINGISINYKLNDRINILTKGNLDYMQLLDDQYDPKQLINSSHLGTANRAASWVTNYNYYIQANYHKDLKRDAVNFMVAHEYQNSITNSKNQVATNMNGSFASSNPEVKDSLYTFNEFRNAPEQWAFLSYFARGSYSFARKLFLEATARVDGSSRFGLNNRYGFFPAFAASWLFSEEKFMRHLPWISFSKLRVSYGKSGNANIPNYQRFGQFANPSSTPNYDGQPTTFPIQLENKDLRWETSWTLNYALEMGFLNDRITFVTEYYTKKTQDVLMSLALPPSTGFTNYWDNVGKIENRGVEFSVTSRNLTKKLKWTTTFNIARNWNEITSIGVFSEDAVSGGTNDTRIVVGEPVGTNYLVRFSHIDPNNGRPVYYDKNGNLTYTWDPNDRVAVGHVTPNAIGGISNSFSYKNFDFSFLFNFVLGGDIYESSAKRQLGVVTNWNMRSDLFDRWQKPGDNSMFPVLTLDTKKYGSGTPWINTTQWLHDGTFARLRNVSLSYRIPEKVMKKIHFTTGRVTITGTNLLTFTRYSGLDPEIARDFESTTDRNLSPNITYLTPPQEKTYSINLTIGF